MVVVSPNGTIREANEAAHGLLEYEPGSLVGLSLAWISPPSRHELLRHVTAAFEARARRVFSTTLLRESGAVVEVELTVNPCLDAVRGLLVVTIAHADGAAHREPDEQLTTDLAKPRLRVDSGTRHSLIAIDAAASSRRTQRVSMVGASASVSDELCEKLDSCQQLVSWLRGGLSETDGGECAITKVVLEELTALLDDCAGTLRESELVARGPSVLRIVR